MARVTEKIRQLAYDLYTRQPLGQARRPRSRVRRTAGNDIINIQVDHVSLDSTAVKVHPDGTGALKKTVHNRLVNRAQAGQPKFTWLQLEPEQP